MTGSGKFSAKYSCPDLLGLENSSYKIWEKTNWNYYKVQRCEIEVKQLSSRQIFIIQKEIFNSYL